MDWNLLSKIIVWIVIILGGLGAGLFLVVSICAWKDDNELTWLYFLIFVGFVAIFILGCWCSAMTY